VTTGTEYPMGVTTGATVVVHGVEEGASAAVDVVHGVVEGEGTAYLGAAKTEATRTATKNDFILEK
jgi:ABC-type uncharacterized transport system permease subunit